MIAAPRPLCPVDIKTVQDGIGGSEGTDDHRPVVFTSRLMEVAFGLDGKKDAALEQSTIRSETPEKKATSGG
jgi:hypothetical protein